MSSATEPMAIPVLRTTTPTSPLAAYRTLIPDRLYLVIAHVTPTHGGLGIDWVRSSQLVGTKVTFDDLLEEAFANLTAGLQVAVLSSEDGSNSALQIAGVGVRQMAAAAVASPGFREQVAQPLGGQRFLAGITGHDHLHVVRADSDDGWDAMEQFVFDAETHDQDLAPTLLLLEPDGMRIVAQKSPPPCIPSRYV